MSWEEKAERPFEKQKEARGFEEPRMGERVWVLHQQKDPEGCLMAKVGKEQQRLQI